LLMIRSPRSERHGSQMNTTKAPKAPFEDATDLEFQRRQWVFERFAGMTLAFLVVLAFLGLFGSGPLDGQQVRTARLDLEYGRFLRRDAPNEMRLTVRPRTADGFTLSLDRQYLEHNRPESIEPEPESKVFSVNHQKLRFASTGPGPFVIIMRLRPSRSGPLNGTLRLEPESAIPLSQFVYP
jgi:hypothetical protein